MLDRNRSYRLCLPLLVLFMTGCTDSTGDSAGANVAPPASSNLVQGDQVKLLEESGEYAKVEDSDGRQWFVDASLLKHRNTAQAAGDASVTHVLVRPAPAYEELPGAPPPPHEPRAIAQIDAEQQALNALFISETSGKEVIAPRNVPYYVIDEETGERCWHAYECVHPECPGEKTDGRPHFLFTTRHLDTQGAIECPACGEIRNRAKETEAQARNWGRYVRPYELPETIRRRADLEQERRRFREKRRRGAAQAAPSE